MNRVNLSKSNGGGRRLVSGIRSSSGNLISIQHASLLNIVCLLLRNLAVELVNLDRERISLGIWAAGSPDSVLTNGSELDWSDLNKLRLIALMTYALGSRIGYTSKNLRWYE